ncbi:hypothetical protein [Pedobacter metabolipauper]|uniref:Lipoprotein n=1 Tax=Pedobacter metabolipauper TaxID=425513 RepID=A0A4V3D1A6_9SPHI|nr:hypothetical protein [Pedobacter metabolipauper]TDQ09887.1 hypothetical protein ATK78_2046 [Pedobacter metabolipauper]
MKAFLNLLLVLFTISLFGCRNECQYIEPASVGNGWIALDLKDKATGDYLIGKAPSKHLPADVFVTGINGLPADFDYSEIAASKGHYQLNLKDFHSEVVIGQDICKRFFIDLKNDADTLDLYFKVKSVKCGGTTYEYFTAKFNGLPLENTGYNSYVIHK